LVDSKRQKHHSLIDKIYSMRNLEIAWEKVRSNKGCAGVDRKSVQHFKKHAARYLADLHAMLKEDRYEPQAILRVEIPKADGRKRPLGIPTVADRVVQQAVLNVLGPVFEPVFLDMSHGFRPGRSPRTALLQMGRLLKSGRGWIVDADIKAYFDTIPHDRLVDFVAERVADGRVLRLVRQFLTAKVLDGTALKDVELGTPQGGVISPLLANIYLHRFDVEMKEAGYEVVRYADDFVVLCRTKVEAERAHTKMKQILENELALTVHPDKTKITELYKGFEFLGHLIWGRRQRHGFKVSAMPKAKAVERFREKIRELTRRRQPVTLSEMIRTLNATIRGWKNFYQRSNARKIFWKLDEYIRRRIWAFISKRYRNHAYERYPRVVLTERYGLVQLWTPQPRPARP
jgi:group II intron reverse transcriptase/maturase